MSMCTFFADDPDQQSKQDTDEPEGAEGGMTK